MRSFRLPTPELPPDSFAVVMATGIVAIAARVHRLSAADGVLSVIAVAAFIALSAQLIRRVCARQSPFSGSPGNPGNDVRALTFVAACAVLGARWPDQTGLVAAVLIVAGAAWIALVVLLARAIGRHSLAYLRHRVQGAWLLSTVASAGLCITAGDLYADRPLGLLLVVAGLFWLTALVAYSAVVTLIGWRVLRERSIPAILTPDAWILMGGLAIATLAGDRFVFALESARAAGILVDVCKAITVLTLVLATAWIPLLVAGEMWYMSARHWAARIDSAWWSAVFPLGMYSVTTDNSARELDISALHEVSLAFAWLGLTAWLIVAAAVVGRWLVSAR